MIARAGSHLFRVVLLALAGCANAPEIELENVTDAVHAAYCSLYVECGLIDDESVCRGLELAVGPDPALVAAARSGEIAYDPRAAAACVAGIAATNCERSEAFDPPDACREVFGDAPGAPPRCPRPPHLGDSCATDSSCIDSTCHPTTLTCVRSTPLGSPCASSDECDLGVCSGTCTLLPHTGEPCVPGATPACAAIGEVCSAATQICAPMGLTGAPCTDAADCSPFYLCDTARCVLDATGTSAMVDGAEPICF